jgi:hypothetical protein
MCCYNGLEGRKVVWKSGESQASDWILPQELKKSGRLLHILFRRNERGCGVAWDEFMGKRDILGMLTGGERGWTRDEKVLQGKFDLSPISVKINGRPVKLGRKTFQEYRSGAVWSASIGELFRDQLAKEIYFPVLGSEGLDVSGLTMQVPVQTQNPTWVELSTQTADRGDGLLPKAKMVPLRSDGSRLGPVTFGTPISCGLWAAVFYRQKDSLLSKAPGTRLILVDDGFLIYDQTVARTSSLGGSGSGVVIASARGLTKDLSTLQLVDNEALRNRMRAASQLLSRLAEGLLDQAAEAGRSLLQGNG